MKKKKTKKTIWNKDTTKRALILMIAPIAIYAAAYLVGLLGDSAQFAYFMAQPGMGWAIIQWPVVIFMMILSILGSIAMVIGLPFFIIGLVVLIISLIKTKRRHSAH